MPLETWATENSFLFAAGLTKTVRTAAQPMSMLRQFAKPIDKAFGKNRGDTVRYDRFANVTTAGGKVNESDNIQETNMPKTQGSVTVVEWGNSIPYTGLLEDLTTLTVDDAYIQGLSNDYTKVIDHEVRDIIRGTNELIKYVPGGTAAAPTSTFRVDGTYGTYTRDIRVFDLKECADQLEGVYFAPKYDADNYVAVVSVGSNRSIFDDPEFKDVAIRNEGGRRVFRGEVGTIYGVRCVKESNSFDNTTNGFRGEFVVFGGDSFNEAVARTMEIRRKTGATTYGRQLGVAWYMVGGWQITWNTATAGEARVIAGRSA